MASSSQTVSHYQAGYPSSWLGFPDASVVALDDAVQVAKLVSDPRIGRIGRIKTMEKPEKTVGFHGILWDSWEFTGF